MSTEDQDVYPALVITNPEAVGDPNQTPIVQLSPAAARSLFGVWVNCPACKRSGPPGYMELAEHLAREDSELFSALSYERRDYYERMAKAALARIG